MAKSIELQSTVAVELRFGFGDIVPGGDPIMLSLVSTLFLIFDRHCRP